MSKPRASFLWPGAIFGLLAMNMVIVAITVVFAASDRSAMPAPDRIEDSAAWDSASQIRTNASLGWKAALSVDGKRSLRISLADSSGRPIRAAQVRAEVFCESEPATHATITFSPDGAGAFVAPCPDGPAGRWQVHGRAEALASVFTFEKSIDVPRARGAPGEP